jgi:hypothetical protein
MSVHLAEVCTNQPKGSKSIQSLPSGNELIELRERNNELEQAQSLRRSDRVK